jgi:hypothetical protein
VAQNISQWVIRDGIVLRLYRAKGQGCAVKVMFRARSEDSLSYFLLLSMYMCVCIWWWRNCFSIFFSNNGNLALSCNKITTDSSLNKTPLPPLYQLVCAWLPTLTSPKIYVTRMQLNFHAEVTFSMGFKARLQGISVLAKCGITRPSSQESIEVSSGWAQPQINTS